MFMDHYKGYVLRGAYHDLGDGVERLWLPVEDIARIRESSKINSAHLQRAKLRRGVDFTVVAVRSELGCKLYPNSQRIEGNPRRLLVSEAGLYRLMMRGNSKKDLELQYWLADEVIPSIRKYNRYDLPGDHPILGVLEEVTSELRVMRDLVWNRSDLTIGDLAGTE